MEQARTRCLLLLLASYHNFVIFVSCKKYAVITSFFPLFLFHVKSIRVTKFRQILSVPSSRNTCTFAFLENVIFYQCKLQVLYSSKVCTATGHEFPCHGLAK